MARLLMPHRFKVVKVLVSLGIVALALGACGTDDTGYIHQTLATGEVGANEYSVAAPGTSEILPREYPGAPPIIPHSLDGLTITKDANPCLGCHASGLSLGDGHTATKIPESHYIDQMDGTRTEELQGMRYNCLLCHLPQSPEAFPLD